MTVSASTALLALAQTDPGSIWRAVAGIANRPAMSVLGAMFALPDGVGCISFHTHDAAGRLQNSAINTECLDVGLILKLLSNDDGERARAPPVAQNYLLLDRAWGPVMSASNFFMLKSVAPEPEMNFVTEEGAATDSFALQSGNGSADQLEAYSIICEHVALTGDSLGGYNIIGQANAALAVVSRLVAPLRSKLATPPFVKPHEGMALGILPESHPARAWARTSVRTYDGLSDSDAAFNDSGVDCLRIQPIRVANEDLPNRPDHNDFMPIGSPVGDDRFASFPSARPTPTREDIAALIWAFAQSSPGKDMWDFAKRNAERSPSDYDATWVNGAYDVADTILSLFSPKSSASEEVSGTGQGSWTQQNPDVLGTAAGWRVEINKSQPPTDYDSAFNVVSSDSDQNIETQEFEFSEPSLTEPEDDRNDTEGAA